MLEVYGASAEVEDKDSLKVTFKMFSCIMTVYFGLIVKEKYLSLPVIYPSNSGNVGLVGATQVIAFRSCNSYNDTMDVYLRRSHVKLTPCAISVCLIISF